MRLIDADAFVKALCKECQEGPFSCEFCLATGVLIEIPTIDAEHVRRGYWEKSYSGDEHIKYYSKCGGAVIMMRTFDYCPYCGAYMK